MGDAHSRRDDSLPCSVEAKRFLAEAAGQIVLIDSVSTVPRPVEPGKKGWCIAASDDRVEADVPAEADVSSAVEENVDWPCTD